MNFLLSFYQQPVWFLFVLILLGVWDLIWKGIGLWHAAKHNQRGWFIALLFINLVGLLPIIYLIWFKPKEAEQKNEHVSVGKKGVKKRSKK
ncbi:MAG: DUF5652 family protein [Nanoarchaeota archaeon]|nr:DUF5652 family protein [Nanoarchaeota archaeon]